MTNVHAHVVHALPFSVMGNRADKPHIYLHLGYWRVSRAPKKGSLVMWIQANDFVCVLNRRRGRGFCGE